MKIRVKAVIVLNGKEAETARVLMHRAIDISSQTVLPLASREEKDFVEKYEHHVSRVDGALAVADGEAVADYAEARRPKAKTTA